MYKELFSNCKRVLGSWFHSMVGGEGGGGQARDSADGLSGGGVKKIEDAKFFLGEEQCTLGRVQ
jgi:hypothetical protein